MFCMCSYFFSIGAKQSQRLEAGLNGFYHPTLNLSCNCRSLHQIKFALRCNKVVWCYLEKSCFCFSSISDEYQCAHFSFQTCNFSLMDLYKYSGCHKMEAVATTRQS